MKKIEIKEDIKSIIDAIKIANDNIEKFLQPYNDITEHLEAIQLIEENNQINVGIDYESIECDVLRSCINENEYIQEINNQFEIFVADLENWQDESSDKKSAEIQEKYIDILSEIKENFEVDSIECEEDIRSRLFEMMGNLEEIEI